MSAYDSAASPSGILTDLPGIMCLRSVAPRATGSARRVARVALSILAKAALVGAKMVAGAMASTVSYSYI